MRKSNREVTNPSEMIAIMRRCDVCRLALNDEDGYPYIVPLNFGILEEAGEGDGGRNRGRDGDRDEERDDEGGARVSLVFHSALEGRKLELMTADPRASFEMDCDHVLQHFPDRGYCTMAYASVIGRGRIEMVEDPEEKVRALDAIMEQFHPEGDAAYNDAAIPRTAVYRLNVEQMVGKRKVPK